MAYTHFRYIAYQVPTVGLIGKQLCGMLPGNEPVLAPNTSYCNQAIQYLGSISNTDAKIRMARLFSVLLYAQENIPADDVTMNVFLAPEFYFRPYQSTIAGQPPAYSYADYCNLKEAFGEFIEDDRFQHWLIIPGSVIWNDVNSIGKREPKDWQLFYNTALCGASEYKVNEKAYPSIIDGMPLLNANGTPVSTLTNTVFTNTTSRYKSDQKLAKHIFNFHEVKCGMEICLEHHMGVLKTAYQQYIASIPSGSTAIPIQLQLLIAGGMTIQPSNIAVTNNAYVLRNDGLYNPSVPQTQLIHPNGQSFPIQQTWKLTDSMAVQDPPGCNAGYSFPQALNIYPELPLS
ncbi:hypothetical protein ECE50_010620 [Chitinophaga sp. Mgbs1]|uniref:Uncharacterized protein n=1 Tax=Chitinophaga solisilvae TaxID=1233460 RepID=A0A9Q5DBC8_9BACT|nr:hypothetical protein [Chitinophaga solisilvae]